MSATARRILVLFVLPVATALGFPSVLRPEEPVDVRFDRDIRPILARNCFQCHGPEDGNREAELRLDREPSARDRLPSGARAVVPGDLKASELYRRISSADPTMRMPPVEAARQLTDDEIDLLKRWILQGAPWDEHWAYRTPRRAPLPTVRDRDWPRNALDYFILSGLEQQGLSPAPPAGKAELIRRVTLDLTGLPPTIEEIDAFLADRSPDAYERLVDRLLQSPRFGERMAVQWLDLARYADTHGYHTDSHREMWRWRDWMIGALNEGMPFDRFTVEQLAGDLLLNATLEQRIATGLHRNTMINFEDGAIAEEYLHQYVADRVDTTGAIWLGQTMRCCRCHDHKYDPLTQRDYYRLYAFFHNVPEKGLDGKSGNAVPFVPAPTRLQQQKLRRLREEIDGVERRLNARLESVDPRQADWERKRKQDNAADQGDAPADALIDVRFDESSGTRPVDSASPRRRIELEGELDRIPGKAGQAALMGAQSRIVVSDWWRKEWPDAFSLAVWVFPTTGDDMTIIAALEDGRGLELALIDGKPHLTIAHDAARNEMVVTADRSLELRQWSHVAITYDGSGSASEIQLFIDGEYAPRRASGRLSDAGRPPGSLRIGGRRDDRGFRGLLDEFRLYDRQLSAAEVAGLAAGEPIARLLAVEPSRRTPEQRRAIREHYLRGHDEVYSALAGRRQELLRQLSNLFAAVPTTMVMEEMDSPRDTFVLARGDYRHKLEKVTPAVPDVLPGLPADSPVNRLGLAQWLIDPDHPLTARVTVNRYWQLHFGSGIVSTPGDFGTLGQWPSHPELLDWLAVEFVDGGWDVKAMHRLIVTSATYRQSTRVTERKRELDPDNRYLSRAPRRRMPAEMVRDGALAAGGLLVERLGGPGVYPHQPDGLWDEISFSPEFTAQSYRQGTGEDLFRRSIYTFWKRTAPPPALSILGAPNRETCSVSRSPSESPLQALVLLNEPTYVGAARAMARRMFESSETTDRTRLTRVFRVTLSRPPTPSESDMLARVFDQQVGHYRKHPELADDLLRAGRPGNVEAAETSSRRSATTDPAREAALAVIVGILLNLDETVHFP